VILFPVPIVNELEEEERYLSPVKPELPEVPDVPV
jgi:hypothetical protein